jgi:hypothetical protein
MKQLNELVITIFLIFTAPANADSTSDNFRTAQQEFQKGLDGDSAALNRAFTLFEQLVDSQPDQPLFLAYLGSSYALKGRDAWMPWTQLRHVERGLGYIDKGLAQLTPEHSRIVLANVPVSVETRLVAITTFLILPGFFNRFEHAKTLVQSSLAAPEFSTAPPLVQANYFFQAAEVAHHDNNKTDEREFLRKTIATAPQSKFAALAQQRIAEPGQ